MRTIVQSLKMLLPPIENYDLKSAIEYYCKKEYKAALDKITYLSNSYKNDAVASKLFEGLINIFQNSLNHAETHIIDIYVYDYYDWAKKEIGISDSIASESYFDEKKYDKKYHKFLRQLHAAITSNYRDDCTKESKNFIEAEICLKEDF